MSVLCKILGVWRGCFGAWPFGAKSWKSARAVLGRGRFVVENYEESGGGVLGRGRFVVENPGGLGGGVAVLCKILRGLEGVFWGVAVFVQNPEGAGGDVLRRCRFCATTWGS